MVEPHITYLEMTDPAALRHPGTTPPVFDLVRDTPIDPARHRALYERVGASWQWTDRLDWSDAAWRRHDETPGVELWVARAGDRPVGFVELARRAEGDVEIAYFGLLPEFIGLGYGGAVLAAGLERAWQGSTRRVWLHTCDLDHPHALANYQARGLAIYRVEPREA